MFTLEVPESMLTIAKVMRDGVTLDCWLSGGKHFICEPPELPFFYDREWRGIGEQVIRRLLSNPDVDISIVKRIVANVYRVRQLRRPSSMECWVRFIERLAQDFGFAQNDTEASLLAFDIEASSSGQFPRPELDRVRAIALVDGSTQVCFTDDDMPESEILAKTGEVISKCDSDLLGTYSGTAFDYEFTLARARVLGIDLPWGRPEGSPREPYTKKREYLSGKKIGIDKTTYLSGRICFDIYKEVRFDPYLSGIRRGLKSVGRFFFGDEGIIELDRTRLAVASGEMLHDYCLSDARLTWKLGMHYLDVLKTCALVLKVPLDFMVYRSPSHIGNIVYGREFNKLGIVSDGSNVDRFTGVLW